MTHIAEPFAQTGRRSVSKTQNMVAMQSACPTKSTDLQTVIVSRLLTNPTSYDSRPLNSMGAARAMAGPPENFMGKNPATL